MTIAYQGRLGAVRWVSSDRYGGVSPEPFESLNLGDHVGDAPDSVQENRRRLFAEAGAEDLEVAWLQQVHGTKVVDAASVVGASEIPEADASFVREPGVAAVVMTADCLPVVFFARDGSVAAAAHAGWRGLVDGVLKSTVEGMGVAPAELCFWLGPCIGPESFEVGPEVRERFLDAALEDEIYFAPSPWNEDTRYVADLHGLARRRIHALGVPAEGQPESALACTYREERFFSYRRDGQTGRMATAVWLADGGRKTEVGRQRSEDEV